MPLENRVMARLSRLHNRYGCQATMENKELKSTFGTSLRLATHWSTVNTIALERWAEGEGKKLIQIFLFTPGRFVRVLFPYLIFGIVSRTIQTHQKPGIWRQQSAQSLHQQ